MSTFIVPELVTTDFTSDFDGMVKDYIFQEYSISNPNKTDTEHFKFKVGLFDYHRPYEIALIQTDTAPPQYFNGGRNAYTSTGIEVGIRMKRISRDKPDPQLGNMEREIIRIAMQYRATIGIPGIKTILWDGGTRVYTGNDTYAESDWRSLVRYRIFYEKRDLT